jgi:alpha-tubulin suppressor-like RCC1 family protein
VQVGSRTDWIDVVAGTFHTCALAEGSSMWCWGDNGEGQLGTNTSWSTKLLRVPD